MQILCTRKPLSLYLTVQQTVYLLFEDNTPRLTDHAKADELPVKEERTITWLIKCG